MSAHLRQCRQRLAEALVQASNQIPDVNYCSVSGPGPILYVSGPVPSDHPEMIHNPCLSLAAHNPLLNQHRADCRCVHVRMRVCDA